MALFSIPIIYLIFESRGIDVSSLDDDSTHRDNDLPLNENTPTPSLKAFYETFRHVDWKTILDSANKNIDIVVYYYDSWVNANYDELVSYFKRPGTSIRLFVADPNNEQILDNINRLFPEYTRDEVKLKVLRTGQRIAEALNSAGGDPKRLEVFYVPHVLNYSAIVIDDSELVLSVFEMYRNTKIDSPALVIDLKASEHLFGYWSKELKGLLENAKAV